MINDLRFAIRMIATHRWFSAAVIVTLALGIGVNTTVFTLVNAVLFKPVPIPGGERLVAVHAQNVTKPMERSGISYPDFLELRAQNHTFEGLEGLSQQQGTISEAGNPPQRFELGRVSPHLFELLHLPPVLGRGFSPEDGKAGAPGVILIGHHVWERRYGGSPDVIGRAVRVNGAPATIIGVMPSGCRFPSMTDIWMPLVPTEDLQKRTNRGVQLFGLLKPGVPLESARTDLAVIASRLAKEFPDSNKDQTTLVRTFHQAYNGDQIRQVFLMMLGAVAFVLLIACANVANMLLSRAVGRAREIAVRAALGASRAQLIRQLLVESVLLSSLGGLLGLGLSHFGVRAFDLATSAESIGKPYWIQFTMDYVAFGYFAAISVLSGIVFGLVPALRATRVDLNTTLKDGAPAGGSGRGGRLTAALVVVQFALTVVLLAGAGLLMRSFFAVQSLNPFVRPESVFTARIQLPEQPGERYAEPRTRVQFYEQLLPKLAALPGITNVAVTSFLPGLGSAEREIEIEGKPPADPQHPDQASFIVHSPGYLAAIGLPLLTGRNFADPDGDAGKEVTVVTHAFAAKHWPEGNAVGRRVRFRENGKPGEWMTVIGVCADIVQDPRNQESPPLIYLPYRQQPWGWAAVLLRTQSDPATAARLVRAAVQDVDQDLPLFEAQSLPAALDQQRWFLSVFGTLFLSFALIGLLLASVGIYAVVAQATSRRTREIGIRMALGATTGAILRLVLGRGVVQLGIGVVLGLIAAFGATGLMAKAGILQRVSPHDPVVFVAITVVLVAIGAFACWLPATQASRIAPTEALRTE